MKLTLSKAQRTCQDCGADISDRHGRAHLCEDCASKRKSDRHRKQSHDYWRKITKPLSRIERAISGQFFLEISRGGFYPHPFDKLQHGLVELPRKKQLDFTERWERFFPEGTPQPQSKRCRSCHNDFWFFHPNPAVQFTREILEVPEDICLGCFKPEDWNPKLYTREDHLESQIAELKAEVKAQRRDIDLLLQKAGNLVAEPAPKTKPKPSPKPKPAKKKPAPKPRPKPNPKPKKSPRLAFLETTSALLGSGVGSELPKTHCSYCYQAGASRVLILGEIQNLCGACQDRHKEFIGNEGPPQGQ